MKDEVRGMEELLKQFMGQMDSRFEQMEKRMEKRFDQIDARFEQIDVRFEQIDARFDKVELDIKNLTEEVRNNQTENRSHFKHIETQLDSQQQTFQVVTKELTSVKMDIDFLLGKTGKYDAELNKLTQRMQI